MGKETYSFQKLVKNIEDQIKLYRSLLDIVRKEKEILVSADLDQLSENNKAKETILLRIRGLETSRLRVTSEVATELNIASEELRLLEIAKHCDHENGERLRNLHSVLHLLLKRVQEHNKQNETLVQSALSKITGAMKALKDNIEDKPTYAKKGAMESSRPQGGHLVRKEV